MGRNIVVLSDGTGNAASSRTPTNVWRLYQALDLSNPAEQVAFYDDGIGTERLKPLRVLGGAFGFGLKRNVLDMYKFLSRSYQPGDRVFVFGFSRGAYTVRVLVGLIHCCGLVRGAADEADLDRRARRCYAQFRKEFSTAPVRLVRWLTRQHWDKLNRQPPPADDTRIRFVGVWDTVDAYGIPIDELATAWDYFIYPYRFADRTLSPIVDQAAHAIALDDERHTFHPVLWDESGEAAAERIRQVWFAGAHANVGGGYPDDSLAHVSLDWMLSEIEDQSGQPLLKFLPRAREALARKADVHGKLYDSRSGLQAYYRFRPRNVFEACNDPASGVWAKPRIHQSVFTRIGKAAVNYAPFNLPGEYEVVPTRRGDTPPVFETADARKQRIAAMEDVWDLVHWRRWLYITMLVATFVLVISPAVLPWTEAGSCPGGTWLCAAESGLKLASPLLPDWTGPWQRALGQNPLILVVLAAIFAGQAVLSRRLQRAVARRSTAIWSHALGNGGAAIAPAAVAPPRASAQRKFTRWLRTLCVGHCAAVRSAATAVIALSLLFAVAVVITNKVLYGIGAAFGLTCQASPNPVPLMAGGDPLTVTLDVSAPCRATGILLVGGERYTITVEARPAPGVEPSDPYPWRDGVIPASPDGLDPEAIAKDLTTMQQLALRLFAAFRRVWTEDWFVLMGQTGRNSLQPFAVGPGIRWFKAPSSDELFLFVNDAVFGVPYAWALPYSWRFGANRGTARITVAPARAGRAASP